MARNSSVKLGSLILLAAGVCLAGDSEPARPPGDWQNVHMASYADVGDLAALKACGTNVVLANVSQDQTAWSKYYAAATQHDIKLVPMIWGVHQTAWQWNDANAEWELDAAKYPASVGARFLAFLQANPKYLAATFAVYAFHEPHNPETPRGLVPADRQRKFWRQIRQDLFPDGKLKIYGESVAWHRDTRNGCVDYDGWSLLYPFVTIAGRPAYRPYHWAVKADALGGIEQWPGPPTTNPTRSRPTTGRSSTACTG